jgi:hypothetical protein
VSHAYSEGTPPPSDEKESEESTALIGCVLLTLLVTVAGLIVYAIINIIQPDPETRKREQLEQLHFTNIELRDPFSAGKTEAWVSVGGCRIHLKQGGMDEEDGWVLTGGSVVSGISGQPTPEKIRAHPKYAECAKQPAPAEQSR